MNEGGVTASLDQTSILRFLGSGSLVNSFSQIWNKIPNKTKEASTLPGIFLKK